MAILTAGNFYWAGYKPAGVFAAQNPDYVYERGTTLFGTALSLVGGDGGSTGYSWNEAGNWFVQKSGFTNDPANPGGFVEGFYYENATRTPRTDDNVFYTSLTPDDPGVDGFYPASECLFGGITGGDQDPIGGGTWQSGEGFAAGVCGGNLNKLFVEQDYSSFRGASFQLGNVLGSTFGQQFLGNSANIKIGGLTTLNGTGGFAKNGVLAVINANLIFTNTDGTTVEFIGNTFLNFTNGGTGVAAITAGISAGFTGFGITPGRADGLKENQFFIGTKNISGSTFATEAIYRSLVTGISSGKLKMIVDGSSVPGATLLGITQQEPGLAGNSDLAGKLLGNTLFGAAGQVAINFMGNSLGENPGRFVGGTENLTEQPVLSIKADTVTVRGDSTINLRNSRIDKQLFVLSGAQFNYEKGRISQAIFARDRIDYLGPAKTAASLLDTEIGNSVVISGGGFQKAVSTTTEFITIPDGAVDPDNYQSPDEYEFNNHFEEVTVYFETNNAGATFKDSRYGGDQISHGEQNSIAFYGGLASCVGAGGCTMTQGGIGEAPAQLFLGRERQVQAMMPSGRQQSGGIDRALSFTETAYTAPGSTQETTAHTDLVKSINYFGEGSNDVSRLYVKLEGQQSSRTAEYMIYQPNPDPSYPARYPGCKPWGLCNEPENSGDPALFPAIMFSDYGRLYDSDDSAGEPQTFLGYPFGEEVSGGNSTDTEYRTDFTGQFIGKVYWQEGYESSPLADNYTGDADGLPPGDPGAIVPEGYFLDGEIVKATFIRVPRIRLEVNNDFSGTRPVTYVRPTNTIPNVVIDAMRHGNVIIEGTATTLDMKPEHEHQNGQASQGKVFINKPLDFSERLDYTTINLKAYNDAENIAGTKDNNLLFLNAGLTIGDLDIGAGTVAVGTNIGDREITVIKGEMSERAVLKARSETNPSYQGFKIGDDFTAITSNAQGILISHPAANIEFSTGHFVLASFADGNTGAETGFQRPGGGIPVPAPEVFGKG